MELRQQHASRGIQGRGTPSYSIEEQLVLFAPAATGKSLPSTYGISSQAPHFMWWSENVERGILEAIVRISGFRAAEGRMPNGSEITVKLGLKDLFKPLMLEFESESDVYRLKCALRPYVERLWRHAGIIDAQLRFMDHAAASQYEYLKLLNGLADKTIQLGAMGTNEWLEVHRIFNMAKIRRIVVLSEVHRSKNRAQSA